MIIGAKSLAGLGRYWIAQAHTPAFWNGWPDGFLDPPQREPRPICLMLFQFSQFIGRRAYVKYTLLTDMRS